MRVNSTALYWISFIWPKRYCEKFKKTAEKKQNQIFTNQKLQIHINIAQHEQLSLNQTTIHLYADLQLMILVRTYVFCKKVHIKVLNSQNQVNCV